MYKPARVCSVTFEIGLVLFVLAAAVVLFVTEAVRMDLVALLVLAGLALTRLVSPAEALSGFSNPAVVTIWAVFILSAGLSRTGVANAVGRQIIRLAGDSLTRLIVVIMLFAGLLSAFMNNVGVAALLLPVVMDIARRTNRPPSKLLIPLAFGALLGGTNTLMGTPPNILVSDIAREAGLQPFGMFAFAPVGLAILLGGVLLMALVGQHLLPGRDIGKELTPPGQTDLGEFYALGERLFVIQLPADSGLAGHSLLESRIGAVLGLNVLAILRGDHILQAPAPSAVFQPNDRLLVEGRLDVLKEMSGRLQLMVEGEGPEAEKLVSTSVSMAEVEIPGGSALVDQTLRQADFRKRYAINVLAIHRGDSFFRTQVKTIALEPGDRLLIQGPPGAIQELAPNPNFANLQPLTEEEVNQRYHLQERLMVVRIIPQSALTGKTLVESRLGDVFGFNVLGIVRGGTTILLPEPKELLQADDRLLVKGKPQSLTTLNGLQDLKIERQAPLGLNTIQTEEMGVGEAVLSPRTGLAGKTLAQLHFRDRYGLNVLAVWRQGRAIRSGLAAMALQFGDALLLYGPKERLVMLGSEPDFIVLTETFQPAPLLRKAPLALLIMAAVLISVITGWLPVAIATVVGAALMVVLGCLKMEEAYRSIEWKAVFLIAGMLPLGIAAERTGAAGLLAAGLVDLVGNAGPLALIAGLFLLAALASQVMPNPAVVVLLAPIAISTAAQMNVSPYTLLMTIAVSASASFLSPVAHPANALVMGPGGYRFVDFLKVGGFMTVGVLAIVLVVLPVVWPP